jgi:uncharacterized membrane protein
MSPDARRTELVDAVTTIRDRARGRRVAGVIVVSDGADTSRSEPSASDAAAAGGPPVFTIGVGSPDGPRDREIVSVTAGDARFDESSVDVHVSAVSSGYGSAPFQLRLLANGRPLESRQVTPRADRAPIDQVFVVAPDPLNATVYTAEIAPDTGEPIVENNVQSVFVPPAGRKRRILALVGAPGYEHSFLLRALARDPGLEIDTVVRKGRDADGQNTFFVQAGSGRSSALTAGFPSTRDALYAYDAMVVANVEGDFFTRAQLTMAAELVSERGGGLLVLGGRSFAQRGLIGTPLEEVLPLELNDRRGGLTREPLADEEGLRFHNKLALTAEGAAHPVMRVGGSFERSRDLWASLPPLAGSAALGGPRPGASVLAVTSAPGVTYPVVAVQRYGQGRSMVFAGEAAWRWRMLLPSTDRTFESFWRQAIRWLAGPAPDPVSIDVPDALEPLDAGEIVVHVRDGSFQPVADAVVEATVTVPGGETRPLSVRPHAARVGVLGGSLRPDQAGLYRVQVRARRGSSLVGQADRWFYVGGSDRELAGPRRNDALLERLAESSGGRYVDVADAAQIPSFLAEAAPQSAAFDRRDLWHQPWAFALVLALLSAEWMLRRRWGLR